MPEVVVAQFILMLAASITGFQRAMSASMRARTSSGVVGSGSMTGAASLSRTVGDVIASITAARTAAITAGGVLAGATMPFQASASTSTPDSLSVGMPGMSAERCAVVMARILTLPDATCGVTEIAGRQAICTSLRINAVTAAGEDG